MNLEFRRLFKHPLNGLEKQWILPLALAAVGAAAKLARSL
jgi:hypothetical protein